MLYMSTMIHLILFAAKCDVRDGGSMGSLICITSFFIHVVSLDTSDPQHLERSDPTPVTLIY